MNKPYPTLHITQRVVALLAIALFSLHAGCTSVPNVSSTKKEGVNFSSFRTYAIADARGASIPDPNLAVRLGTIMRSHLATELEKRGYVKAPTAEADVVFDLVGTVSSDVFVEPSYPDASYHFSRFYHRFPLRYGIGQTTRVVEVGHLAIFAIDRRNNTPVWAGWIKGEYDPSVKEPQVIEALNQILAKLPERS